MRCVVSHVYFTCFSFAVSLTSAVAHIDRRRLEVTSHSSHSAHHIESTPAPFPPSLLGGAAHFPTERDDKKKGTAKSDNRTDKNRRPTDDKRHQDPRN